MDLKKALKTEASRLGFTLFGITTANPPQSMPAYSRWLVQDRYGGMQYLAAERAIERRADPAKILPEVRSILVVGLPYSYTPAVAENSSNRLTGLVAGYAWGNDYHDLILTRLNQLVEFLHDNSNGEYQYKVYTDTGPILERDLAARAGLGWQGKNTCLINPKRGSYFLLGEILTTMELDPDMPFVTDHCGSCRRCIEACPTECILPDRTIDARHCISYLTIENKGEIPVELRPKVGAWVFGCDICQQVCPWNIRFAENLYEPGLLPDPTIARPDLINELQLTPHAFNQRFKDSPIKRARRRGYLRNVAVALGNAKSPTAIPALESVLQNDPEPLVRTHAAWALGQIDTVDSLKILFSALGEEKDPQVISEIRAALE